jgi:predicted CXXCH cytochrome family protein
VRLLLVALLLVPIIFLVAWFLPKPEPLPVPERQHADYVGSGACAECHPRLYPAWQASVHARAFQPAGESTVLGEFTGVAPVTFGELTTQSGRRQGNYAMALSEPAPAGKEPLPQEYPVHFTLGAGSQTQAYLTLLDDGRLQVLPIVWDAAHKVWYDQRRELPRPDQVGPGSPFYWTGYRRTANLSCLDCHASQLEANYEPRTDTYRSTWTEPGVNCETCHGPAKEHVDIAHEAKRSGVKPAGWGLTRIASLTSDQKTALCAQCHSFQVTYAPELKPGENYYDHFLPYPWLYQGRCWPDGTPRDQNYQYLSFLQSRCTRDAKFTCTTCHNPHRNDVSALRPRDPQSDRLCTRCHTDVAADLPAHTHHPAESPGSRCLNCHMPRLEIAPGRYTTDHRITVPVPQATVRWEVPNACSDCHRSETPEWAARQFTAWYGQDPGGRDARGLLLNALSSGDPSALASALEVLRDPEASPPLRAAVALLIGPAPRQEVEGPLLDVAKEGPPLLQAYALTALSSDSVEARAADIAAFLTAPLRAVRFAAAGRLAEAPDALGRLGTEERNRLVAVLKEAFADTERRREDPTTGAELAAVRLALNLLGASQRSDVVREYRLVLERYPDHVPTHAALAQLYLTQSRFEEALAEFTELAKIQPGDLAAQVGAAQCLTPLGRPADAANILEKVLEVAPTYVAADFHLGLAYRALGKTAEARSAWEEVLRLDPGHAAARALLGQLGPPASGVPGKGGP